jgi:malonyl-CoA/methylmalonyl-CoA synthetase
MLPAMLAATARRLASSGASTTVRARPNLARWVSSGGSLGADSPARYSFDSLGERLADVATERPADVAVVSPRGVEVTYGTLLAHADALADSMRATFATMRDDGRESAAGDEVIAHETPPADALRGARVAISAIPGPEFDVAMKATWMCGAIAVPIARKHTKAETTHVLQDSGASVFVHIPEQGDDDPVASSMEETFDFLTSVGVQRMVSVARVGECDGAARGELSRSRGIPGAVAFDEGRVNAPSDGALIIYTSGTTGSPKGALHTHGSLAAQCTALMNAWDWSPSDRMYHALPLHHIHGLVNGWACAAATGATVEFAGDVTFAPRTAWARLRDANRAPVTVFMGVPTMYVMMLRALEGLKRRRNDEDATASAAAARSLRLTVSGSASLPTPVARSWMTETGADVVPLERYGMTEIGMALSNPLRGERRAGTVGAPLPGVEVRTERVGHDERVGSDATAAVGGAGAGEAGFEDVEEGPGELLVRGPSVFVGYWNKPDVTASSFTPDGFFRTGDTAVRERGGYWRIMGRTSVDIIKTGGFKVSALETEAKLLEHPAIAEVAVFGVPDDAYGEIGVAVTSLKEEEEEGADTSELARWARRNMAEYKAPKVFQLVRKIPRNAMGKVNKKELRHMYLHGGLQ